MNDLVERLRNATEPYGYQSQLACEAADRIEELERDAERYRWLRDTPVWDAKLGLIICNRANALWDTVIDEAMKEQP